MCNLEAGVQWQQRRYREIIMAATLAPRSRVSKGELEVDKARELSAACLRYQECTQDAGAKMVTHR